jgi:hypothetical protein
MSQDRTGTGAKRSCTVLVQHLRHDKWSAQQHNLAIGTQQCQSILFPAHQVNRRKRVGSNIRCTVSRQMLEPAGVVAKYLVARFGARRIDLRFGWIYKDRRHRTNRGQICDFVCTCRPTVEARQTIVVV